MAEFPLGGKTKNYNSKKSRESLINLIVELSQDGTYKTVRRVEGLTRFATLTDGPIRSDLLVNAGFVYVVSDEKLFRVNEFGVAEDLGSVGGSGRAKLSANSVPGDSQILILNGNGAGYIYDDADGLVLISDTDFFSSTSVTILDERFWLTKDGTNEFFGSEG